MRTAPGASGDACLSTPEQQMVDKPTIEPIEAPSGEGSALEVIRQLADAAAPAILDHDADPEIETSTAALRSAISRLELSQRLRLALADAAVKDAASMDELRVAVCEFTVTLREEGTTPEATLIRLKSVVDHNTLPKFAKYGRDRYDNALRQTISTWCIKAYFEKGTVCS